MKPEESIAHVRVMVPVLGSERVTVRVTCWSTVAVVELEDIVRVGVGVGVTLGVGVTVGLGVNVAEISWLLCMLVNV
jgi:hypothetical protein